MSSKNLESREAPARKADEPKPADKRSPAPPPPRRRSRFPLVLLLMVAVAAAGGAGYYLWRQKEQQAEDRSRLVLEGNIDVRQVNLAFKVDGRIESLAVDEGDQVKAGQVLATLDKRYFDDDLQRGPRQRDNAAATLARLEHGSRPEEIAEAQAQVAEHAGHADQAPARITIGWNGWWGRVP